MISSSAGGALADASRTVESHLLRALELAKGQEAKLFELRAAVNLSRYWAERGKAAEARALLTDVYAWFTESLEKPDLRAARSLIVELAPRLMRDVS